MLKVAELKTLLVGTDLVDADVFDKALKKAETKNLDLETVLVDEEIIGERQLAQVKANFLKVPFMALSQMSVEDEVLQIVPEVVAKKQRLVVFKKDAEGLYLGMEDPTTREAKLMEEFLANKTGLKVHPYIVTGKDLDTTLNLYTKDVKRAFDEIIEESVQAAKISQGKAEPPIITIVETTINYAYQNKASDIHIEPTEEETLIRFRIDGVLHDIVNLPLELHEQIVTRIKVLSNLRTDEHQAAQDGKIRFKTSEDFGSKSELDIRVSIVPITEGEKVVMRLLSERSRKMSLADLGFSAEDLKKIKSAYTKPHGMILATGPTGSGKTTTLYAILKLLNKRDVNIMTIEDPVEYDIEGVNQIQVNVKTKLTFAKGLRSIVRQDPDIILVGEVRDEETAGIAINSAMTGHLVLSTLHTNDAATSIPRLLDLQVEPFLVASTVNVVVAQRLVRAICQKCRASVEGEIKSLQKQITAELLTKHFGEKKSIRTYKGEGCGICHETGYMGRVGIFEVMVMDDKLREAVTSKKDASEIRKIAVENGMQLMIEDGIEKVKQGVTTIEEVLRVTKE